MNKHFYPAWQDWTLGRLTAGLDSAPPLTLPQGVDAQTPVRGFATLEHAVEGELCFLGEPRLLWSVVRLPAGALCLISPDLAEQARQRGAQAQLLETPSPKQLWCHIVERTLAKADSEAPTKTAPNIHPSAIVSPDAKIAEGVRIDAYSVIAPRVEIGKGTTIGAHCVLEEGVFIGAHVRIGAHTVISHSLIADRVTIHTGCLLGISNFGIIRDKQNRPRNFPQIGCVIVKHDAEIFANVTVGRGAINDTVIGVGARIGPNGVISHNCMIGDYTIISPRCALGGSTHIGSYTTIGAAFETAHNVRIGDRVGIGGRCAFWPGVRVADGVQIMNSTNVEKNLNGDGRIFYGSPALPLREELKRRRILDQFIKQHETATP